MKGLKYANKKSLAHLLCTRLLAFIYKIDVETTIMQIRRKQVALWVLFPQYLRLHLRNCINHAAKIHEMFEIFGAGFVHVVFL